MKIKRFTAAQRELLLSWIAEGLDYSEIRARAAQAEPPFTVAKSTVSHYRKTRDISWLALRARAEAEAINAGYETAEERIERLSQLARELETDLLDEGAIWLTRTKIIGQGKNAEKITYQEFNTAEIDQYRGILDDIARETGGRKIRVEQQTEVDLIWDLPAPGWLPPGNEPE